MFKLAYSVAPIAMGKAAPGCVYGSCPEGRFCCGNDRKNDFKRMKEEAENDWV